MEIELSEKQLADVCVDCGSTNHCAYMVKGEVWEVANLLEDQGCCLTCLLERLSARDLELEKSDLDFDTPVSWFVPEFEFTKEALRESIRRVFVNTSVAYRERIRLSVLKQRREHPQGLTMRQVVEWVKSLSTPV